MISLHQLNEAEFESLQPGGSGSQRRNNELELYGSENSLALKRRLFCQNMVRDSSDAASGSLKNTLKAMVTANNRISNSNNKSVKQITVTPSIGSEK